MMTSERYQLAETVTISEKQHTELLTYLHKRLDCANLDRGSLLSRIARIDMELAGYLSNDHQTTEDQKREERLERGESIELPPQKLPMANSQIDDMVAYIMKVFASDSTLYNAIAELDKQEVANTFAKLMNDQAKYFKHFTSIKKIVKDFLKYNFAGGLVEWQDIRGSRLANQQDGTGAQIEEDQLLMQGNALKHIDMYNFLWDTSVSLDELAEKGEFCAIVELETDFRVRKWAADKKVFGIEEERDCPDTSQGIKSKYYTKPPTIRNGNYTKDGVETGNAGWDTWLTGTKDITHRAYEVITIYIWLNGKKYGLSTMDKMGLWQFIILNNSKIIRAVQMNNVHSRLPVATGILNNDSLELEQKSYAEMLIPLQNLMSHQFNTFVLSNRKKLVGGLTIYDSTRIKLGDLKSPINGMVAATLSATDSGVAQYIKQLADTPDTKNFMQDIENIRQLAQNIIPTSQTQNMAGLDRSTMYQAAATIQEGNRKLWVLAVLFEEVIMFDLRFLQMQNIFQYQLPVEILDNEGAKTEVSPSQFRDAKLEFTIANGIKGVDQLIIHETIKEVIQLAIQAGGVQQGVDVLGLLNYYTSMIGDKFDLQQFRIKNQFDALTPEQKQQALTLLQTQEQGALSDDGTQV